MKNAFRKAISILLVAVVVLGAAPLAGFVGLDLTNLFGLKAEAVFSGYCGSYTQWTADTGTGILDITGRDGSLGAIPDYDSASETPWYSLRSSIKVIRITATAVGKNAFADFNNVRIVSMSDSVKSIGYFAFQNCTNLASLTIGNGVTSIGPYAFRNCTSLESVTIPGSVESIGYDAFQNCTSLESVTIPDSVESIGFAAFQNCTSLESITVDKDNPNYSSDEYGVLFNKNKTVLMQYPVGNTRTSYVIPDGVETIDYNAFKNCTSLESITIPDSVTSIGSDAFYNCQNLTSVTIPDSVTSIRSDAFYNCQNLTSITIPDSVTSIGDGAFYNCTSLTSITIPDSVTSIACNTFTGCTGNTGFIVDADNPNYSSDEYGVLFDKDKTTVLSYPAGNTRKHYDIPDTVKHIGDFDCYDVGLDCYVFSSSSYLESITIPDTVETITGYAFHNCTGLTDIYYIGTEEGWNGIRYKEAGNEALLNATVHYTPSRIIGACGDNLTWTFDETTGELDIVGKGAMTDYSSSDAPWYSYRSDIKTVEIGNGVTTIGNNAFKGYSNLTDITISESVTSIGVSAFENCDGLKTVTIPDGVKTIGKTAFGWCNNLSYVTIGKGVNNIGEDVFYNPYNLISIDVDENNGYYSSDEYGALFDKNKTRLIQYPIGNKRESYAIPNGVEVIDNYVFYWCDNLKSISVPDSVKTIGKYAFAACSNLTEIILPDGVENIGSDAFNNCDSITSIVLPDSVKTIGSRAFGYCNKLEYIHIPASVTDLISGILTDTPAYICAETEDCFAKTYADQNGIEFRLCTGHNSDNKVVSGECGDNLTWTHNITTGVMVINGTGAMWDWSTPLDVPWYEYRSSIKNVRIGSGVTSIGGSAFAECVSIKGIAIPDSVTSIGDCAFLSCDKLTSVTLPESVITIGKSAFESTSLSEIIIPDGTTDIGYRAFYDCVELKTVEISDSVTIIGDNAFYDCVSLETVTVGNGIETIGYNAFFDCVNIADVYYNSTELEWNRITVDEGNEALLNANIHFISTGKCGENLTYTLNHTTGTLVISGTGAMTDYSSSDAPWYSYRSDIKTVEIGNGVTSIGSEAFSQCYSLTSVEIPDSVTSIGSYAFFFCRSLESVTIPDSVESIGLNAFQNCTSLASITVDKDNPNYSSDEYGVLFNKDKTELIQYLAGNTRTSYTIPDSVTSIGEDAFCGCDSLTSVEIPDSVTSIGKDAFWNCTNLESVTIPDSVTSIGSYAFFFCRSLESVTIPGSVISIGEHAFLDCDSLTSVTVDASNAAYSSDEYGALFNKDKTELIKYPIGNTRTSYTIPDSVTSIGENAFQNCENLESVIIGNSVTSIGDRAFSHCDSLTRVVIPDSVTSIGESAFWTCRSLESITIPDSVTSIGESAFYSCDGLTSVVIPDSVTSIGEGAFACCLRMERIHIPSTVTAIGESIISSDAEIQLEIDLLTTSLYRASEEELAEYAAMGITKETIANLPRTILICSDSEDGLAKKYAEEKGNEFKLCEGHGSDGHSHIPGEWVTTVEPDCTSEGIRVKYCKNCEKVFETDTIDVLGHDIVIDEAVEATCTETGLTEGQHCSRCDDETVEQEVVPALEHDIIIDKAVEATCTETGLTEGQHCSRCDDATVEQEVVPALEHDIVIDKAVEATCTETGLTEGQHCSRCDGATVEQKETPVLGHTESDAVIENNSDAECGQAGSYDSVVYCSACGEEISRETITVDALEHQYDEVVTAPTCTESGYTTYTCSLCGDDYVSDEVGELGHDIVIDEAVDATCTETGLTEGQHCSRCDGATVKQKVVPALNHKDTLVQVRAQAPTCTKIGWDAYEYCTACGYTTYKEKSALEHDIVIDNAVAPTCTETGLTAGQHCSRCDDATIEQKDIPVKPHSYSAKYDSAMHWKECVCGLKTDEQNHSFVGGNICSCGYKRVTNAALLIKNNTGSKTIDYGETLKLTAIVTNKPDGAKICWYVDGVKRGEGEVFNVNFESGTKIITVKLVDSNGVVYQNANGNEISDSENVTVNSGFFQKLISFFKNLFGSNRTVVQMFKGKY